MGLFKKYINQTRKPEGALGKLMLQGMNSGHAKLADWGLEQLPALSPAEILELGCGGGRNAGALLRAYPAARVTAVDHSALSVERTLVYNREAVHGGRCVVQQRDVSDLRMEAEVFDLATAFETIYFWPGLEACFREVAGVLKPGGTFLIVNESDGTDPSSQRFEQIIDGMTLYTPAEIEAALHTAGFSEVETRRYPEKPWIAVLARKA